MSDSHVLIHIGQGEDRKTYDVDFDKILNVEFIAIERVTGLTVRDVAQGMADISALAATALVWVIRKRSEPTLRFDQVEFAIADLSIEDFEDDEAEQAAPKEATPIKRAKKRTG